MKYWCVWVSRPWYTSNEDIYIEAESEDDALLEAMEEYDHDNIDSIEEVTEEEYNENAYSKRWYEK